MGTYKLMEKLLAQLAPFQGLKMIPGMKRQPRDYQMACDQALWEYLHNPESYGKNPLIVLATGLGKSLNIAMFVWRMLSKYPRLRMMCLAHVKELVESNYRELRGLWPSAPAGVYAAGLGERDTRSQVTFAMINSVAKRAATFGHIDFVVIDEAHRLSPQDATLYGIFLKELRKKNPRLIVIGYTATDYRMKGGKLTDIGLFDDVVFNIGEGESFLWAVEQGYLILPVPTDPGFEFDDSAVGISGGEYKDGEAEQALRDQDIQPRALEYTASLVRAEDRKRGIGFCQTIDLCEEAAEIMTHLGFESYALHSRTENRDDLLKAHKRGEFWGLFGRDILTTGYNDPMLDLMIGLRLSRSPGLWTQMVGRMTRPVWLPGYDITTREGRFASITASGKLNARVLDFTGNTERLGPINYPNIPGKRKGKGGQAPVRKCTQCDPPTFHHVSVKVCPHCSFEFPVEAKLNEIASGSELVSPNNPLGLEVPKPKPKEYEIFSVHEMTVMHNQGKISRDAEGNITEQKLDTVMVTYRCGTRSISQWVCFAHPDKSYPRRQAEKWWKAHGGQGPAPTDIKEAVDKCAELNKPIFIKCEMSGRFMTIEDHDFVGTRFEPPDLMDLTNPYKIHEPEPDPYAGQTAVSSRAMDDPSWQGGGGAWGYDDDIPF